MFVIIENHEVMRDAEGYKLTYENQADALQALDYIEGHNPELNNDYRVVPLVHYALNKEV